VILSLLAALLAAGCGGGDKASTQSFVGKTESVVLYVTWTREGDKLTGSLTQGVLDQRKSDVTTKRGSLSGKVSGTGVTIDLVQQYGETTRLDGTLRGDVLELEYLSGTSGVTTVQMEQGTAESFNAALSGLRDRAEQSKVDATTSAAEGAESQRVLTHVDTVLDDIAALKTTADASLPSKGVSYNAELTRLQRDMATLKGHAKDALAADSLSVCSSAALVQSDADTVDSDVTALEGKLGRAATGTSAVNDAIKKLLDDFDVLEGDERKYVPDDAPTRLTVNRAITAAHKKLKKRGGPKGNVLRDANAMLTEARRLEIQANSACRTAG
jgi:hypothetical protein